MSSKAYKLAKLITTDNIISNDKIDTTTIDNLNDVDLTGISDGNGLKWDGTSWVAGEISSADTTGYATPTYLQTAKDNLVGSAPTALDTIQEIAGALQNSSTSLDNFISFISRSKTVEFVGDGSTRSFAVNHIAGNLDVWVNGILQKPNILDSTDTNGSKSLDVDDDSFPFTFDFDYYSTDNVTVGYNGILYADYSVNKGLFRLVRTSTTEMRKYDYTEPYDQNTSNPNQPIYELIGDYHLASNDTGYLTNNYPNINLYDSKAYFYFTGNGQYNVETPTYVYGYNVNLYGRFTATPGYTPISQFYYDRIFTKYAYTTIIKTAKTSCSHIFFPDPPSDGSVIKVRVY